MSTAKELYKFLYIYAEDFLDLNPTPPPTLAALLKKVLDMDEKQLVLVPEDLILKIESHKKWNLR